MEIVLMKHGVSFFVLAILVGALSYDHHHKAEASSSLQNGTSHLSNCSHGSSLWGGCRRDPVVEDDDDDVEFLMDSDTGRRILAAAKHNYITYGAENRNKPVCRGSAAYRSCLPPPHTAPRRGCQKVYKCRSPPSP